MPISRLMQASTLTVTRHTTEGYYDRFSNWVDGVKEEVEIKCNIQPYLDGKTRDVLPEGIRAESVVIIYSKTQLNPADQLEGKQGDHFDLDGHTYRVISSANWSRSGLLSDHYRMLCTRKDFPLGESEDD